MSRNIWVDRDTQVVVRSYDDHRLTVAVHTGKGIVPRVCLYDLSSADKETIAKAAVIFVRNVLGMRHDE